MALSVAKKLRILEGERLFPLNAPADFEARLGPLPAGTKIVSRPAEASQVHWFVKTAAQVEKEWANVRKMLRSGTVLWTYYPKGSSGIQTDLSRDRGWDAMTSAHELQWLSLISFDATWSAFGSRLATESDRNREKKPQVREIFQWIDAEKKVVRLPDDLATELRRHAKEAEFFNSLSFTNRKEYVEWIVTAKRPETRLARVNGSIERLGKSWKNPQNL